MAEYSCSDYPLFGGAISTTFPHRFQDVSNVRQVPDHQEVFVDPARDESLIIELLDLKVDVADSGSATWFLQDLANEQDAEETTIIEQSQCLRLLDCAIETCLLSSPLLLVKWYGRVVFIVKMAIFKGRQGREAQNLVKVYLANLCLKEVGTDVLITAYEPLVINPLSDSATAVGAGTAVTAAQSGVMPMAGVFKLAVSSFKVHDWSLFGSAAA